MKIIILVDFNSENFNIDFKLANGLLQDHVIFLAKNISDLGNSEPYYDFVLIGNSIDYNINYKFTKPYYKISAYDTFDTISDIIQK